MGGVAGGRVRGGSWSQCMRKNERGLSMNCPSPGLRPPSPRLAGRGQGEGCQSGSWSQCMRKNEWGLSMNRPLTPSLSPSDGERVAEGQVRGGSGSQCMRKNERGLSMNRRAVIPLEFLGRSCWDSWPCLFLVAGLALGLCGCASYRLGPANPGLTRGKTVQVNFFGNKTLEPRLVEAVNHALRKSLQQDGTYKLNTRGDGDIIVNGAILRYEREGVSFQPNDILTVRDYQVTLMVKVTATERATGKVVLDREVTGRTTVRVGSDLPSAERQALPLLADNLARNATTLLVEGSW